MTEASDSLLLLLLLLGPSQRTNLRCTVVGPVHRSQR